MSQPTLVSKRAHLPGCEGVLHRMRETVCGDVLGRIGNGGIVYHEYRCTHWSWGPFCPARVLVPEAALRDLALAVEERP